MLNRQKNKAQKAKIFLSMFVLAFLPFSGFAEDGGVNAPVADYQVDGTMFQKITDFEQEKLLLQMDKERAQLDLDLDRLAAEKIKLQMELQTMANHAEEQKAKLESEKQKLQADKEKLEKDKNTAKQEDLNLSKIDESGNSEKTVSAKSEIDSNKNELSKKYKLIEIIGAGNQLQATLEDLENGQKKKAWSGKDMDGYQIKSISLDDGVVFVKNGETQILNISK